MGITAQGTAYAISVSGGFVFFMFIIGYVISNAKRLVRLVL